MLPNTQQIKEASASARDFAMWLHDQEEETAPRGGPSTAGRRAAGLGGSLVTSPHFAAAYGTTVACPGTLRAERGGLCIRTVPRVLTPNDAREPIRSGRAPPQPAPEPPLPAPPTPAELVALAMRQKEWALKCGRGAGVTALRREERRALDGPK